MVINGGLYFLRLEKEGVKTVFYYLFVYYFLAAGLIILSNSLWIILCSPRLFLSKAALFLLPGLIL